MSKLARHDRYVEHADRWAWVLGGIWLVIAVVNLGMHEYVLGTLQLALAVAFPVLHRTDWQRRRLDRRRERICDEIRALGGEQAT